MSRTERPRSLAGAIVERRRAILIVWACATIPLGLLARTAARRLEAAVTIEGSPAASVDRDLDRRFHSPFVHRVLLVAGGLPDPGSSEGRALLEQIVEAIRATPGVTNTVSFLDSADRLFVGRGGEVVVVGLDPGGRSPESLIPPLREVTTRLRGRLSSRYPGVELDWTGEVPLNLDLRRVSAEDARASEVRAVPVALLLLLVAFGSLVAALFPLSVGLLAVLLTMGTAALLARAWHLSILVQNIASMIGLGLGTDYALLMVSRFRESLAAGGSATEAAETGLRRAGRTLLVSALPVVIAFAILLTIPTSEFRSIGAAGLLVTLYTFLLSTTLLPACLATLGRRVGAGRLFGPRMGAGSDRWRRWGSRVVAHPWVALVLAGGPTLVLAGQALRLQTGTLRNDWFPRQVESVRAVRRLEAMGRGNVLQTLRVLLDLPRGSPVTSPEGWIATRRFEQALESHPGIERVHSLATAVGPGATREGIRRLDETSRRSLVSGDERCVLFEVLPAIRSEDPLQVRADSESLARRLRSGDVVAWTGLRGAALRVGGLPAANAEFEDVVTRHFRTVVLLVMGATFVALLAAFRSVLIAAKAIALNLLSVGAAFGALVLVFQDGHGAHWFGLPGPTDRIIALVPVLVFAIVFGLSMDYEVFLVTRVWEARRSGLREEAAIVEGMAKTGGVITSAASIMVAVFAAFAMGAFLPVQMLGFALTVAVLLDATVVRMVVGPALLRLAGRWNWWPGWKPAKSTPEDLAKAP